MAWWYILLESSNSLEGDTALFSFNLYSQKHLLNLICISRTFYILKMKEAETWHCLRTEAELTFPDFESPNYIMPIPSLLKVHVVTSILFLVVPSQTYGEPHSCSWKLDYVQSNFPHYTAGDVMLSPLLAVPGCRRCFSGRGHSLLCSQADHSLPRSQSLGWYFLESNVIIKVSVQLLSPCHSPPRGQAGSGTN